MIKLLLPCHYCPGTLTITTLNLTANGSALCSFAFVNEKFPVLHHPYKSKIYIAVCTFVSFPPGSSVRGEILYKIHICKNCQSWAQAGISLMWGLATHKEQGRDHLKQTGGMKPALWLHSHKSFPQGWPCFGFFAL